MIIIHEFTSISIDYVTDFPQDDLDVDVFMNILLGMEFYWNIEKWFLKLKNYFMDSSNKF